MATPKCEQVSDYSEINYSDGNHVSECDLIIFLHCDFEQSSIYSSYLLLGHLLACP